MRKKPNPYSIFQLASAVFMILALLWLTVSTPFVYASQQELAKQNNISNGGSPLTCNDEEVPSSLSNTTEEKNSKSNNSFSEEYLHDHHIDDYFLSVTAQYHNSENAGTYIAFHGEVQVPPPNVA